MTKLRSERKQKKRLWPKIAGVIVLLLMAGVGYMYYLFEWKSYDIADDELESIAATPYETNLSERRGWDDPGAEGVSTSEVVDVYQSTLDEMKETTRRRVAEVANRALADYQAQEASGNVSMPYLYQKYTEAADEVERQMDKAFEEMHGQMVNDLRQVDGDTKKAELLREDYESYKQQLRRQMLSEAGIGF